MEWTIGIFLSLLTLYFTFKYDWKKKPVEEKKALLVLFRVTQDKFKETKSVLTKFVEHHNIWDAEMFPGITYRKYLAKMDESYPQTLSENVYNDLANGDWTKPQINIFMQELNSQYAPLKELLAEIQLKSQF